MEAAQSRDSDFAGDKTFAPYVRLAQLEIERTQLANFKIAANDHAKSALHLESGMLAFHAVSERDNPGHIRVFEVYADREAYKAHLQAPHFQKFRSTTAPMVITRKISDTIPVVLATKQQLPSSPLVRIAVLEIDHAQLDAYKAAVTEEIETSVSVEPGVLTIYSVALKDKPTHLHFFEIYANEKAYRQHLESPHFKKYVEVTKTMITAKKLFETDPIFLGAKPR